MNDFILPIIGGIYVVMSLITLIAYGLDKRAAVRGDRRTPEKTLHLLELACGWPGALFAQQLFRHKSRKGSFLVVTWLCIALNCAGLVATGWWAEIR
jgi:uncharacterized membrane protein YsdA (DUF1294 family)